MGKRSPAALGSGFGLCGEMGAAWQREGFLHPENEGGWVRVEAVHGEALSFGAAFAAVLSATERAPAIPK